MQQPFRFFSRAAMLLLMMLTATTAWAETINGVSYIDENGETQTADNVTVLTGNEEPSDNGTIDLTPGWYVVNSTVNYTRSVTMETKGEYHIILADGGKMNIGSSANPINNNNPRGIDGSYPIYIYGQTNGTGELNVYTGGFNGDAICVGDLTINGGKITAIASGADGSGLRATNNVTINGGVITARATCDLGGTESFGIKAFNRVIINGGQVTAWGSNKGIYSSAGSISLSWKNTTDFIDVNSYYCYSSLTIATGKVFTDGNGSYYIEANASEVLALTNTRLMPTQDYKGYSVVFDSNGGSDVPTQIVLGGFSVTEPTAPTKAGKVFCGWYLDSRFQTAYDFTSVVTGNLTLYAKWADAISYNLRDALIQRVYRYTGRVVTPVVRNNAAQLLTAGTDYKVTSATQMVRPGVYTLTVTGKGSYTGGQTVSVRVLTFDKSDGTNLVTNCTLPANNSNAVVVSSADSTMQSGCWYVVSEDATVAKRISVNGDVNLVLCDGATLTAELGISVTDGNSLTIYSQSGNTGTLVAKVPDHINNYHAAIGGDRDDVYSSPVKAGTITIHGGVINAATYSLAEDIGAANNGEAGTINIYGGKITTSGSHDTGIGGIGATVHLGWCRESSDFIESQGYSGTVVFDKNFVIDGTSIVATQKNIAGKKIVPTAKTLCTVTFQTNGGSTIDALHLFSGTTVPEPDIPFRAGYQFAGWYTNDGCTDPYDFNTAVDHSFTLYAKWDNVAPISYIDADGHTVTGFTAYTPMENSYIELPEGTYFVGKNTTVSSRIELSGTVNLILGDGATLTAEQGIHVAQHNTLNIFAQSAGTGALTASADNHNAAIGATHKDAQMGMNHSGIIRIYGGVITANGSSGASAIGGRNEIANGAIYIYGGTITATTDEEQSAAIGGGKTNGGIISILGGKITATNKDIYGYGIGGPDATIHLDLRKASDFIHASGYMGTVNIMSGLLFTDGTNIYSGNNVSIPNNVTLTQANFTDDGNNSYTIHNAAGWDVCCDALQDNATYNRFIGKTVYLANDITVTRMAGSDYHDFCGTFDGQGNTITLDLDSNKSGYALFRNAVGATIKNLHVDGTIVTAGKYAAGLISGKWGDITIENCRSSVTIKSSVGGDGTHGGFVAVSNNGELNIKGCVFDGKIVSTGASATTYCGGFVGWRGGGDLNISNSLYAPAEIKSDETEISGECTFARNGVTNITNTYYTRTLGDAQGKAAHSITAGENVSVGHAEVAKTYSVSGITAYKASGASSDSDPFIDGIVYNDVLYAGDGDEVSLTLSNSVPMPGKGYQYAYTASTGTLSGSTLTMPADDVTINVALEPIDWAKESSGDDADHAYMIYNKDQLLLLAYRVNGTHGETVHTYENKFFMLGADIKFEHPDNEGDDYEENYEAIGGLYGDAYYFKGDFDGNGKTVSGIRICIFASCQGLFGHTQGANIYNVHVTDARITGYNYIGGIVGMNENSTVSGCTVTESAITAKSEYGTICGINEGITDINNPRNNYYHHCTVNGKAVISGVGCNGADITDNDGAVPMYVDYIDADGNQQRCIDYTELDDAYFGLDNVFTYNDVDLTAGKWYVVKENVYVRSFTNSITVSGSGAANIILCDDKTFDLGCSGKSYINGSLNIYGQSKGTGEFNYNNNDFASYTEKTELIQGNLTIYGGQVVLVGHDAGSETNGQSAISGNVTIHRGSLCAKGGDDKYGYGKEAINGDVTFNGGSLTAIGGSGSEDDGYGIWGKVVLSWSNADDNFYASSYSVATTIAAGQIFTDGNGHYYAGTLSSDEIATIGGQTLQPFVPTGVTLATVGEELTATFNGSTTTPVVIPAPIEVNAVTLNRSFSAGKASTVMLPFDYTCNAKADGGDFYDFVGVEKDKGTNQWVATMTKVDQLKANTPYMFVAANDIDGITFTLPEKVTLDTTGGGECQKADKGSHWTFKGTYSYMKWTSDTKDAEYTKERADEIGKVYGFAGVAKDDIKLGDFVKAASGARIRPLTCYLIWNNTPNSTRGMTRAAGDEELPSSIVVRLLSNIGPGNQGDDNGNQGNGDDNQGNGDDQGNDDNGGTTTIGTLDTETGEIDFGGWYTLSGRKLDTKPTQKGLYIHNGKKIVIK